MRALAYSALLNVENLRILTSQTLLVTLEWIGFGYVHKLYTEVSDCVPAVRRPKLVTETGLMAVITTPVLTFLFTGRDAASLRSQRIALKTEISQ